MFAVSTASVILTGLCQGLKQVAAVDSPFYNNATADYLVQSLPQVDFALPELYAGRLPLTNVSTPFGAGELFFVFAPKEGNHTEDLTIWLQGGPGCSSLGGFFQENGPIIWPAGSIKPTPNVWSWTNQTHMLWVDQPAGVGMSVGPSASVRNEIDVAVQFLAFLRSFQDLFGIKNYRIFITGESYAGVFVPYIGAEMLARNDQEYGNLSGAIILDPSLQPVFSTSKGVGPEATSWPYIQQQQSLFHLNTSVMAQAEQIHEHCWAAYIDRYLVFPANEVQPSYNDTPCPGHSVVGLVGNAAYDQNPCFSAYIHRPIILSRYHGGFDWTLNYNGTLLQLQNMTWNGVLGFTAPPTTPVNIQFPDLATIIATEARGQAPYRTSPQGMMGLQTRERGLLFSITALAGHQQPITQPRMAYRQLEWLLGDDDML